MSLFLELENNQTWYNRIELFLENKEYENITCCIETSIACDKYPQVKVSGKKHLLTRLVLQHKLDRLLDKLEVSRHTCHNSKCINPNHLEPGTQKENIDDLMRTGYRMGARATKNGMSKFSKATVDMVFELRNAGLTFAAIGQELGMSQQHANDIYNSKFRREG